VGRGRSTPYSGPAPYRPAGRRGAGWAEGTGWAGAAALLGGAGLAALWVARRFQRVSVTGLSMAPALQAGDRLLVWRTSAVRPGDIVAAHDPRDPSRTLLKRAGEPRAGHVWLEGDDPEHSTDSRHFGPVPIGLVQGRAVYRYFPPARAGRLNKEVPGAARRVRG